MKSLKSILLMGVVALFAVSCNNDDDVVAHTPTDEGLLTPVSFDMDVSAFKMGSITRALNPVYNEAGFTIYAFKQENGNYVCNKIIQGSGMTYNDQTKKLTGTASIPIGTYKFVPVYGLASAPNGTIPTMLGQTLSDNLLITQVQNQALPEIFLMEGGVDALTEYTMGMVSVPNLKVTATLKRAVARVDIMFISAQKDDNGNYIEQKMASGDILGSALQAMSLNFRDLNQSMDFFGTKKGSTIATSSFPIGELTSRITIGDADATIIGDPTYLSFDNVQGAHLIEGAAHIGGLYFIPNPTTAKTVGLDINVTNTKNETRNIKIDIDNEHLLPLVRNNVTLVKVYVISEGGGNTIFDTNVNFEIEIETQWLGSNTVEGEMN